MQCPKCQSTNIKRLRGYWEDLPAESLNRGRYAPPDEPTGQPLLALLAVAAGIFVAVTSGVLIGLGIAVAGLLWGAFMVKQQREYEAELAEYDGSTICLAKYHVF